MTFQSDKAMAYCLASRSRFVRLAATWLGDGHEPIDLLLSLSHESGQAFGPWETFRFCALLQLVGAAPVRELGLDVLYEPMNPKDRLPPIAQAGAVAHALAAQLDQESHADAIIAALVARQHPQVPEALRLSALYGLAAVVGSTAGASARAFLRGHCAGDFGVAILEAARLAGDDELFSAAADALVQDADGNVRCDHKHPTLRALVTLRALCLFVTPPSSPGKEEEPSDGR